MRNNSFIYSFFSFFIKHAHTHTNLLFRLLFTCLYTCHEVILVCYLRLKHTHRLSPSLSPSLTDYLFRTHSLCPHQVCRVLPDRRVRWGHTASTVLLGPRVLWDRMVCRAVLVRRELQELRAFPASLVLLVSTAFLAPPVRRVLEALRVRTERGGCRDRMARPAHLARLAPQDLRVHRAR